MGHQGSSLTASGSLLYGLPAPFVPSLHPFLPPSAIDGSVQHVPMDAGWIGPASFPPPSSPLSKYSCRVPAARQTRGWGLNPLSHHPLCCFSPPDPCSLFFPFLCSSRFQSLSLSPCEGGGWKRNKVGRVTQSTQARGRAGKVEPAVVRRVSPSCFPFAPSPLHGTLMTTVAAPY